MLHGFVSGHPVVCSDIPMVPHITTTTSITFPILAILFNQDLLLNCAG
jgi:hypothetical protein